MKQFIAFVKKEFKHIFRDRITMLILFIMPIVMIMLFSYAISTEVKNINVAVLDYSNDYQTKKIIEEIRNNKYFTIKYYLHSQKEIIELFQKGKVNVVIVFPENFSENMIHTQDASIQLIADGTEANQASMYVNYVQNILIKYLQNINNKGGKVNIGIITQSHMLYNPQSKSAYNYVPGVLGMMLLLINAMMSSIAIVRERERGTMEMLLASPLPPIYIILAKAMPFFTISSISLILIFCFSFFIIDVPIAGSVFVLVILCLLYILTSLAMGLFISNVVNNQLSAMLISGMVLMLPTMLLSGMMFPIESMPEILQDISYIIPARWFISAIRKIMIQGVGITYIMKELLALIIMCVVYILGSLKNFKIRLE